MIAEQEVPVDLVPDVGAFYKCANPDCGFKFHSDKCVCSLECPICHGKEFKFLSVAPTFKL